MKYHTTRTDKLEKRDNDNNDDDFLVHLLEELMDATAYITKLLMQRKDDNVL
jgi:hypothetical protein